PVGGANGCTVHIHPAIVGTGATTVTPSNRALKRRLVELLLYPPDRRNGPIDTLPSTLVACDNTCRSDAPQSALICTSRTTMNEFGTSGNWPGLLALLPLE